MSFSKIIIIHWKFTCFLISGNKAYRESLHYTSILSTALKTHEGFWCVWKALLSLMEKHQWKQQLSAGNDLFTGGSKSLLFESDLYIHHHRGKKILILRRPHTCLNSHICMGMNTYRGKPKEFSNTQRFLYINSKRLPLRLWLWFENWCQSTIIYTPASPQHRLQSTSLLASMLVWPEGMFSK